MGCGQWARTAPLRGHRDWVMSVVFAPSGEQVLTGRADDSARLWDAASGHEAAPLRGIRIW
ncbi:hypothetical protein [Plasticicumulans sp.]|uniref:hypothetical protein n=1 Tax=Plasticicumulans sp. TaxID=2307179 RepID=UPI0039647CD7